MDGRSRYINQKSKQDMSYGKKTVPNMNYLNHFYYEDDGFWPWRNLPAGPLSLHI